MFEPMNPAPPVTKYFILHPFGSWRSSSALRRR
jgi:hypothetical protein